MQFWLHTGGLFVPKCSDFTSRASTPSGHYSFSTVLSGSTNLNWSRNLAITGPKCYPWGLIRAPLAADASTGHGLDAWSAHANYYSTAATKGLQPVASK